MKISRAFVTSVAALSLYGTAEAGGNNNNRRIMQPQGQQLHRSAQVPPFPIPNNLNRHERGMALGEVPSTINQYISPYANSRPQQSSRGVFPSAQFPNNPVYSNTAGSTILYYR